MSLVVRRLVQSGEHVIDVGANVGWYTKVLSELVGQSGRVYSIEPIPSTFDLLSFCIRKLRLTNVDLTHCAISSQSGSIEMVVPTYASGGENFYQAKVISDSSPKTSLSKFHVPMQSLDALFAEQPFNVAFIKCDVEGHELPVIQGARQLIAKSKPAWLIEVSGNPDDPTSKAGHLFHDLESAGYAAYWYDEVQLKKRAYGDQSVNYFFLTLHQFDALKTPDNLYPTL